MKRSLLTVLLAAVLAVPLALTLPGEAESSHLTLGDRGVVVKVTRVIDGDTVEVNREFRGEDNVRLIGIDTPEVYGGKEPYGPAASNFTTNQLEGRKVALEFEQERFDSFDRPLAHVWRTPHQHFGDTLARQGYAQRATYLPNDRYEQRFLNAQQVAKNNDRGIWGMTQKQQCKIANHGNGTGEGRPICDRFDDDGEDSGGSEPGVEPASKSNCPSTHRIKGNIADDGEKIYHVPSGQYYEVTDPERCFSSRTQAENAGYRASER